MLDPSLSSSSSAKSFPGMAPSDFAIRATGVGKIFCHDLMISSGYAVRDMFRLIIGRSRQKALRADEFHAIKDISFEIDHGEVFGILGGAQSGKSTLAALLAGLYSPDEGTIETASPPLLINNIGTGFRPMLDVRENAVFKSALLGVSRDQIEAFVDRVLEFSDLQDLVDRPLFNLSPEQLRRLGISISFLIESDILVIDNILPVGSPEFREKCMALLTEKKGDTTIVYITSKPAVLEALADRVLVLDEGQSAGISAPTVGIAEYNARHRGNRDMAVAVVSDDEFDDEGEFEDEIYETPVRPSKIQIEKPALKVIDIEVDGAPYLMKDLWLWLAAGDSVEVRLSLVCVSQIEFCKVVIGLHAPFERVPVAERFFTLGEMLRPGISRLKLEPGQTVDFKFSMTVPELPSGYFGLTLACLPMRRTEPSKIDFQKVLTFGVRGGAHKGLKPLLNVADMMLDPSSQSHPPAALTEANQE